MQNSEPRTALGSDGPVSERRSQVAASVALATLEAESLTQLLAAALPSELEASLTEHVRGRRWFRGKARALSRIEVLDSLPLRAAPRELLLAIVRVVYQEGPAERYVLPLAFAAASEVGQQLATSHLFELLLPRGRGEGGVVYDPTGQEDFSQLLLQMFLRPPIRGERGTLIADAGAALRAASAPGQPALPARVPSGEQSNTSVFFGQELMLKLFRQLESGENPDVELNALLWARGFRNVPEPLGSVRYERADFCATLAIAQRFVPSQGTAWDIVLEILQRSLEYAVQVLEPRTSFELPSDDLLESSRQSPPHSVSTVIAETKPLVELLGVRTAELHLALSADDERDAFKPEPFGAEYMRELAGAARERVGRACRLLGDQLPKLPPEIARHARDVLAQRELLTSKLDAAGRQDVRACRIRCHGDYHLGQVLYDGRDFVILDFEGEPAQPIEARRRKQSALYDVCGMLRSFHYAATVALQSERFTAAQRRALEGWVAAWHRWSSALYLGAYFGRLAEQRERPVFLPEREQALRALLQLHSIDKCSYELGYELNNRPAWVRVPLAGLSALCHSHSEAA